MAEGVLTAEAILLATEDVLRRFGPAKATVVDVARALGVSHGSVYRHFPSKAALRAAVTRRWLLRAHRDLEEIVTGDGPAPERLRAWLAAVFEAKRRKALDDPELFATYAVLVRENSAVIAQHIDDLVGQLTVIIADGGLGAADPATVARAVFDATNRFHDPAHASQWSVPGIDAAFDAVCDLLLAGLTAPMITAGRTGAPPPGP